MNEVKYRRPLNKQQIRTLHLLYWYRFCTSRQLARSFDKNSPKSIQSKLQILEVQELIGKRYNKSYRLAGRSAEYFITPKGARALEKANPNSTNAWVTKSLYKNKTVSDDFLKHCITVTETAQRLRAIYGDSKKLHILSKGFMAQLNYYPSWTPDLHIEVPGKGEAPTKYYFLDIWDGTKPFFVSVRKTRNYVSFKDSGGWQEDELYPAILAICEDEQTQKKLNRQMKRILDEAWDDELVFATTTGLKIEKAARASEKIWYQVEEEESVALGILVK